MVRRRSKRKPRFTRKESSIEQQQQQQQPTRKRGRPRKTVKQEERDEHGGSEEEELEQHKKMKLEPGLDSADQHQVVEDEEESAAVEATDPAANSAATRDVNKEQAQAEEVKPKSRRKSQPRKST